MRQYETPIDPYKVGKLENKLTSKFQTYKNERIKQHLEEVDYFTLFTE